MSSANSYCNELSTRSEVVESKQRPVQTADGVTMRPKTPDKETELLDGDSTAAATGRIAAGGGGATAAVAPYVDSPPSYSVFVVGSPSSTRKTTTTATVLATGCRGCHAKKNRMAVSSLVR